MGILDRIFHPCQAGLFRDDDSPFAEAVHQLVWQTGVGQHGGVEDGAILTACFARTRGDQARVAFAVQAGADLLRLAVI